MKRLLVTGISGFIAAQLLPKLKQKYEVFGIDSRFLEGFPYKMYGGDVSHAQDLQILPDADAVLHLAAIAAPAQANANPSLAYAVNVLGTNNVLQWCVARKVEKVVFLSTAHVYGISPRYIPTPEEAPILLQNDTYTTTKIIDEYLCQQFFKNYQLPYVSFRLYNAYGPRQTTDYFIPAMMANAKKGEIILKGAETTKDWVYIDDTVEAILKGLETDFVGELNIGSGTQTPLKDVASVIAASFGAKFSIAPEQPPATHMQADITRIKKVLGWEPTIPLNEGLARTIEYFKR